MDRIIKDDKNVYLIRPIEGFTPQIGHLVSMMNYVRYQTLKLVNGLTVNQLDYRIDGTYNSIGALLEHFAANDIWFQISTFENRTPTDEDLGEWKAGADLGEYVDQIKGHDLGYYLQHLQSTRARTLIEFAKRDDDWLYLERISGNNTAINMYNDWFHVLEDEVRHCGQIIWIKKKIKELGI